jgi:hypothetical protein
MPRRREIDDAEPSMAESNGRRNVNAFIIRSAIGKGLTHFPDEVFTHTFAIEIQFSADATHRILDFGF